VGKISAYPIIVNLKKKLKKGKRRLSHEIIFHACSSNNGLGVEFIRRTDAAKSLNRLT